MKIDEMPILHSALTSSDDNLATSSKTSKTSEENTAEAASKSDLENNGEVIVIYVSPSQSGDESSETDDDDDDTLSDSSSEDDSLEPTPGTDYQKQHVPYKRYVGDFGDTFSGPLKIKWNTAKAKVDMQKKKIKAMRQRNRRLIGRIVCLRSVLRELREQRTPGDATAKI